MAKKGALQKKAEAKAAQAVAKAAQDGRIRGSELQSAVRKYGQAAVSAALASTAAANSSLAIGSGAKDLTGVRSKNGVVTYTPSSFQYNDIGSGTIKTKTVNTSGLGPQFVSNAAGGYTYIGPGTAAQGSSAAGGSSNPKPGTQGYIDQQLDAYQNWAQTTIDTLTAGQGALNQQITDLQARNAQSVADITSTFNSQLAASQSAADQQIAGLQSLMMQQNQQFQQASAAQQQQAAAAQAAYEEQRRQSEALARAYVPNMEPTASNLTYGSNKKQEETNLLSSLTMVSPTSSVSPYLVGLQIA